MKKLSSWIQIASKGWVALASLLIFLAFTAFVLPQQAALAEQNTGSDASPDMSFFYTSDDLYHLAESYGEEGRAAYVRARFTFDLVWPLIYALFLATAISWSFQKSFKPGSPWHLTNLVPIAGMLLDYFENIATSMVMIRYPDTTRVVDLLAPIFTALKWIFVGGGFVLLLIGLLIGAWKWISRK